MDENMDLVGSHGSVLDLVVLIPVCSKPQLANAEGFLSNHGNSGCVFAAVLGIRRVTCLSNSIGPSDTPY